MPAIERRSGRSAASSPAAPALQQLDLDRVHRVDVGVAQPDRLLEHRVAVEQLPRLDDLEHGVARAVVLVAQRAEDALRRARRRRRARGSARRSPCSTSRATSRGSRRARGRTASRGRAARSSVDAERPRAPSPRRARRGRCSVSASTRRPTGSRGAPRARRPPAASGRDTGREPSVEQRELVERRERAQEARAAPGRPTRPRGRARAAARETASIVSRAPSGASADPVRERGEERRGDRGLEVPPREPGQPVLERDRLALLGELEAAVDRVRRLGEDRRVGRALLRARRSRRGRGTRSARRRARPRATRAPPAPGRSPTGP